MGTDDSVALTQRLALSITNDLFVRYTHPGKVLSHITVLPGSRHTSVTYSRYVGRQRAPRTGASAGGDEGGCGPCKMSTWSCGEHLLRFPSGSSWKLLEASPPRSADSTRVLLL